MSWITNLKVQGNYLVPVYNLKTDIQLLGKYHNGAHFVKMWAVKAVPGDEEASIFRAVAAEQSYYAAKAESEFNARTYQILSNRQKCMQRLLDELNDRSYYKPVHPGLVPIACNELKCLNLHANIHKAIFLEGVVMSR